MLSPRAALKKQSRIDAFHRPANLNHALHMVLTVFTLGLWLPVWTFLALRNEGWKSGHGWITAGKNIKGMTRINRLDISPELRRRYGW